ncbi:DNA recombination protein RmuC [Humitalea sp. 24SJ18S-53]|uniref:DNA recombination protein RmuC n=1 Tax=Humitalea sp. 24SJ18S-53 TaxID=3422307 RepID=UPI003D676AFC
MNDLTLPILAIAAAVVAVVLLAAMLLHPRGDGAAALLQSVVAAQAQQAERLAGLLPAVESVLAAQSLAMADRARADSAALNDRVAQATSTMTDALLAQAKAVGEAVAKQNERLDAQDARLAERLAAQNEGLAQALAGQTEKVGRQLTDQMTTAQATAAAITERLAVIDAARTNIEALGAQVGSLSAILSNKQTRGAFGEVQLRSLLEDRLPPGGFDWQFTLSTGVRADCRINLPFPPGPIVVDSKFPLEGWQAVQGNDDPIALRVFAASVRKHVDDIAKKYILPGETADGAVLFLPSEAVYADLHMRLPELMEESNRRRVYVVSPTTLWAVLGTMRALMQDVRVRAETRKIQDAVGTLVVDVGRLELRVGELRRHFDQAHRDIGQIEISTSKIARTGERIAAVELDEALPAVLPPPQ